MCERKSDVGMESTNQMDEMVHNSKPQGLLIAEKFPAGGHPWALKLPNFAWQFRNSLSGLMAWLLLHRKGAVV